MEANQYNFCFLILCSRMHSYVGTISALQRKSVKKRRVLPINQIYLHNLHIMKNVNFSTKRKICIYIFIFGLELNRNFVLYIQIRAILQRGIFWFPHELQNKIWPEWFLYQMVFWLKITGWKISNIDDLRKCYFNYSNVIYI